MRQGMQILCLRALEIRIRWGDSMAATLLLHGRL